MRLPESVYNDILGGLGLQNYGISDCLQNAGGPSAAAAVAELSGHCQRRSRRRRLDVPVQFTPHGALNARSQTCILLDLSRDGVCVLFDAVVAPGDRFVIYLPRAADEVTASRAAASDTPLEAETLSVLCTVRSSRLKTGGKFRTGAEFTEAQRGDDERLLRAADGVTRRTGADSVLDRTALSHGPETDANSRRNDRQEAFGRTTMYVYRDDGNHGPMEHVHVRDYSEAGVGILSGRAMAIGEQFVVRVPRQGDKPITRLCRVTNVAVSAGRHRIGAEFIPFPGPRGRTLLSRLASWIA